jgi:hypothetical protein
MKLPWLRNSILACFLSKFKWFRCLAGGKWELWWVDVPVCSDIWHEVDRFTHEWVKLRMLVPLDRNAPDLHPQWYGFRPSPLCRGTPVCEDWK